MSNPPQVESRRTQRLTRLGFHFLFVGAFAMLGGALRGFNLLLVLAGLLVGALIVQWRWSRRSVESVSAERRLPTEAFAGKSFRVRFRLRNHSRWMPAWMMRVEDSIVWADGEEKGVAACAVGVVSPGRTVAPSYDCVVTRRGKYAFGPAILSTSFPFCLFTARKVVASDAVLFVFPKLLLLRARWQRRLLSRSGGVTVTARRSGPTEGEFYGLREWQTGDNLKWIHWRTTARIGDPAVRQFEEQRRFDTCILVDGYLDGHSSRSDEDAETAISLAATILVHLVGSPSNRLVLAVAGRVASAVIGGGSREGKRRMLSMLAEMEPCPSPLISEAAVQARHIVGPTQDLLVVSTRSMKQAIAADESLEQVIRPWSRRGTLRWINVSSAELRSWVIRESAKTDSVVDLPRPDQPRADLTQSDQTLTGAAAVGVGTQSAPAETLRTEVPRGQ